MGHRKSKLSGHHSFVTKAKKLFTHHKGAIGTGRHSSPMTENVFLIWLDSNIDSNTQDSQNTISELRRVVNTVNTFTDADRCIQVLKQIDKEKTFMILSGTLGQQIMPRIHNMSQIDSIFIFCGNKQYHEEWAKDWSKIKGVCTEIEPIREALKEAVREREQNTVSISIMNTGCDLTKKNLDQLDPSFIYTQIMKEILLAIEFKPHHFEEFIQHCREVLAGNDGQLKHVDELERKYHDQTPIWWYTYECFLYHMLNRALRTMDADLMIKLGFFIGDLHRQIEQLYMEQFSDHGSTKRFTVYRGQGMETMDFEQMAANKGGLLSFNCFLSTSKSRAVPLSFAGRATTNAGMVGVLFVMTIDPARSTTPFASIVDIGHSGDQEDEVLFSMHTVFRIGNITSIDGNRRLFQVELTLTSEYDKDLRQLTGRIREETFSHEEGWYRLGSVLLTIGRFEKAQQVYEILLEQASEGNVKAHIYHQLGVIKSGLGEYSEAITHFEKSMKIGEKCIAQNHPNLGSPYSNVGNASPTMGNYSPHQERALAIRQQFLSPDQFDLASTYANIGLIHKHMGNNLKAHSYLERAVDIAQRSLSSNLADLQDYQYELADMKRKL